MGSRMPIALQPQFSLRGFGIKPDHNQTFSRIELTMLTEASLFCPWLPALPVACTASSCAFFFSRQYFEAQGRQLAQNNHLDTFHYKRAAFYNGLKSKVGLVLAKAAALRINLNLDCIPIPSRAYTHPIHRTRTHLISTALSHHLPLPPPRTT